MRYAVVYEKSANGCGAYILGEAVELHIRTMREDGDPIPELFHEAGMPEVASRLPRPVPAT